MDSMSHLLRVYIANSRTGADISEHIIVAEERSYLHEIPPRDLEW